ncbi:MAG: tetratricopeptide repeat protein [Clostridia bacterium]
MILEKSIVLLTTIILATLLCIRFIKRYEPANLVILPLLALSLGMYIAFVIYDAFIPNVLQIAIIFFIFLLPIFAVYLQYNNIVLSRQILYNNMKKAFKECDYKKTIAFIEQLVNIEGRNAEYLYILGMCYKNIRDDINARDCFKLAIEFDPKNIESYYELGLIYDDTNKKELAMKMYQEGLNIEPNSYKMEEAIGICLTRQGRFEEAVIVYNNALIKHPESYELCYNIGIIEMELGNYEKSEIAFKRSVKLCPNLYTSYYNIGYLSSIRGDYATAIDAYKHTLSAGIYAPKGYFKLAQSYAAIKEYDKAMSSLEYAIELNTKYIEKSKTKSEFNPIRDRINKYIQDREELERKSREKNNYMRDKFKLLLKRKDIEKQVGVEQINKKICS